MSSVRHSGHTVSSERLLQADVIEAARGIGIALVVFAHINPNGVPGINFYGFHMPLFFFLSGATLRAEPPTSALLRRDARSLIGYAIIHAAIFALITAALFKPLGTAISATSPFDWRTYVVWPFTQNFHNVQLFLIGWFLVALFFVRCLCLSIVKVTLRLPTPLVTPALMVLAFASMRIGIHGFAAEFATSRWWAWNLLAQISVGLGVALLGFVAQQRTRWRMPAHPLRWAGAALALLMALQLSPSVMSWSEYPGGTIVTVAHAVIGGTMVLLIAQAFSASRILRAMGRSSKWIMAWHLTAFALVNLAFAAGGLLPTSQIGVLTAFDLPRFWPLYVFAGCAAPLILQHVVEWLGVRVLSFRVERPA